ncbi:MAG: Bax inhibitor-1/YccA family protein [Alphaproteobacteria bacterium]|nr:Bax inhibitor-1/YccA family protein [Alphaproteobacteria bacterium]
MTDPFFRSSSTVAGLDRVTFDAGLRAHMQRVFGYMSGGLALTGVLAWIVAHTALAPILFGSPLRWVVALAPLVFVIVMQVRMNAMSAPGLKSLFWLFCGAMGLSMGAIFLTFTDASIARAFLVTSATFGAMSLWGYTTKRDLTGMGAFLMMGIVGLIIASVVNIFLMSGLLQWVVSVAGVAIFTGLTAWDVQNIKQTYASSYGDEANDKLAVFGALRLYLNFINAFQFMLELTGGVRRR